MTRPYVHCKGLNAPAGDVMPGGHATAAAWPDRQKLPAGQGRGVEPPRPGQKKLCGQAMGALEPAGQYLPDGHRAGTVACPRPQ